MSSYSRYIAGVAFALGNVALLAGCGGGGGGGSGGSANDVPNTTVMLANSPDMGAEDAGAMDLASDDARFFGWGFVRSRDILDLTVSITEIYFQYCNDPSDDGQFEIVLVNDSDFDPSSVSINEGGTVRWEWTADARHTITSGSPSDPDAGYLFNEESMNTGSAVQLTFVDPGVYPYFSSADIEEGMTGEITVKRRHGHGHGNHVNPAVLVPSNAGHHGDPGHHDGDDDDDERIGVFSGAFDVSLLDLTDLSQILTTANLPVGEYCRIFIRIENPRLVLKSAPNTVITNVCLTSSGRLSVKEHFDIAPDEVNIILLDFGGIHLFRFGHHGPFLLVSRLKADVRVIGSELDIDGEITAIDAAADMISVLSDGGDTFYRVSIGKRTKIITDDDSDDDAPTAAVTTLHFGDLAIGQLVNVLGKVDETGDVDANAVEIDDENIDTTL